jgi:hypothetical protein
MSDLEPDNPQAGLLLVYCIKPHSGFSALIHVKPWR